jgi:gliding motility-associated-like protein
MNLRITLLVLFAFISQLCIAQTGEDCSDPIPVPYSSPQWCDVYNNVGATTDVSTVTFSPLGLSCNPNEDEIWFSFTPLPPLFDMIISVEGVADGTNPPMEMPRITVVRGDCATTLEALDCAEAAIGTSSTSLTIPSNNFIPGFPYFIIVSDWSATAASNEGAFNLCIEELTEIVVPPTGGTYTSCSGIIHDTGGATGDYSSNENYIIEICPSEAFTCLELDIVYDLEPFSGFSGDFMEITGFVPDLTNSVVLTTLSDINTDGVTILSTGCVSINFQSDGGVNEAGFTIAWNCNQDDCYSSETIESVFVSPVITPNAICQGQCVTLECDPTPIYETVDYALDQIDYNPFPFIGANEVTVNSDDAYSNPIDLPFEFCFYGGFYDQVVLGSNGLVSFDVAANAGGFNAWQINDPIPGNNDMLNAIACPFHDINPASGGGFYSSVYGVAPFRVVVFSFNNVNAFSCQTTSTQQVAMYESTNIIETYISNKVLCPGWNGGAAIHGIQNALGNQATVVPGRNFPDQWTASNDAWRFTPSGTVAIPFTVEWLDGEDNLIGIGSTLTDVCPTETEIYHAEVTYEDVNGVVCSNSILTIRDSAQVTVSTGNLVVVDVADDAIICTGESVSIGGVATPGTTYTWTPTTDLDLTDPANPIATPATTTIYSLEASNGICIANETVTITVVSDPTPTITGVFQICQGATTTLDAGSGYAQYLWSPGGEVTQTIDVNATGDYTVVVTVSATCTGESTVTVNIAADIIAQVVGTTENSCDSPNGAIDIDITTGIAPFTYEWSGDAMGQGQDPVGIPAGNYTVTISDAAGCSATLEVAVTQQDAVVASVDNDTVCIGELVQLQAIGGNGTYIWESSGAAVSDSNIPNPTANPATTTTYYVTSETNTGNLVANGDFEAGDTGFTSNYVLGLGGAFGDLSAEATYGIYTSPDQGHINFDPCGDHTTGASNMLVVNGAGTPNQNVWCQTVTVDTDTDYNFSSWFTSAVVGSPAILQFEINGTPLENTFTLANTTCNWQEYNSIWNSGVNTSATICILNQNTAIGGNDFALDDISFSSYCTQEDSVTVYVSQPLATIINTNDDFCGAGLGSLTVEGTNGYDGYTYQWAANAGSQTTATATNLAGNAVYFVTVTDAYGCATQTSQFVQDLGNIPAEINGNLTICPGGSTILTAGPVVYDTYLWSDAAGTTTDNITVTTPGDYTVTVTSSTCVGTATITVIAATPPTPTISGPTEVCDGTGILDAGVYVAYEWSNTDITQTTEILTSGDYTVTVTDMNGCTGTATTSVSIGNLPLVITGVINICLGESTDLFANTQGAVTWFDASGTLVLANGATLNTTPSAVGTVDYIAEAFDNTCTNRDTVTVTVSATPTLSTSIDVDICAGEQAELLASTDMGTLTWSPTNEFVDPSSPSQTVSPNGTTTYIVTANNNGCEATSDVTVNVSDAPIYGIIDNTTICLGDAIFLGVIDDASTTYAWTSDGETPSDDTIGNPTASPAVTTTYTLTATNGDCSETEQIIITVIDPSVSAVSSGAICSGESATLTATGTPAGGTVTWTDWEGNVVGTGTTTDVSPFATTAYAASYEINGCTVSTTVTVDVNSAANTSISATETQIVAGDPSTITVTGAPVGSTYSWAADSDENPIGDDIITVTPEVSTTYTVTITTPDGCTSTKSIFIEVVFVDFKVPNTFTPNNDGLNDGFFPIYTDLSHEIIEFKVFDRWGELVHDSISNAWDGAFNGKNLPSDIYVYFVRVRFNDGTEEMKKGDVALMR